MGAYPAQPEPVPARSPEPLLWTAEVTAEVMSMGRAKVYELLASGELPSIKIGVSRRIPVEAVREFIRAKLGEPAEVADDGAGDDVAEASTPSRPGPRTRAATGARERPGQ